MRFFASASIHNPVLSAHNHWRPTPLQVKTPTNSARSPPDNTMSHMVYCKKVHRGLIIRHSAVKIRNRGICDDQS